MEKEKLQIIRHSASHVLAQAVLQLYPDAKLAIGPAIEDGFYYDFDLGEKTFSQLDLQKIEKKMKEIIKQSQKFEHYEVDVSKALKYLQEKNQPYKMELAEDLKKEGEKKLSFYRMVTPDGKKKFVDLCAGPHAESTKEIVAIKLLRSAGAYWKGDSKNKMLQRIYGTAFASQAELDEYLKMLEEAEKRDHNKLGRELDLFVTSEIIGQGLPLLTPKGTKMKQILQRWIEDEEERRGYQLTMTPFMAKSDLYKVSGHWDHYRDGMFIIDGSGEEMALRPMTCPFQFMIYKSQLRSYRDLPIRYNETSTLFRNEESGEMHGLIRVRQFTLSEGHIICRMSQLEEEFEGALNLINYVLKTLKLEDYSYRFSKWDPNNKKGKYIDDPKAWEESQKILKKILDKNKLEYVEAEGEAAFYGPKLDIQMKNVYGKEDTIITVQIDFALPERFDMTYVNEEGKNERPIIVHRSSIGCYERTMALLIERYAGAFPLWLSPQQVQVIPVGQDFIKDSEEFYKELKSAGIRAWFDQSNETVGYKIRKGEKAKIPYMIVIGEKEAAGGNLQVRVRGQKDTIEMSKADFIARIIKEDKEKI